LNEAEKVLKGLRSERKQKNEYRLKKSSKSQTLMLSSNIDAAIQKRIRRIHYQNIRLSINKAFLLRDADGI
jgi:hypothetical protein